VRPRDPVELLVERIWAEVLGRPWVGVRDTFGSLGGDSHARRRMLERVAVESGVGRAPDALAREETVEALAAALKRTSEALRVRARAFWARNVQLPPGVGRPALFFIHGMRHGGLPLLETMDRLGPDQPVYGIAPHVSAGEAIPETVEAIARDHLRLIRAIQPAGPYLLGGFCNGAVAAFEAAAQLRREGVRVSGLMLFSPMLPATYRKGPVALFIHYAMTPLDRALVRMHALGLRHRVWRALGHHDPGPPWGRRIKPSRDRSLPRSPDGVLFDRYSAILQAYSPSPLSARATIFWPRREARRFRVPSGWAWRRALPDAHIVDISGGHDSWTTGQAAIVAAHELRHAIDLLFDERGSDRAVADREPLSSTSQ
jgi:thioesterase domain-containing protein